VVKYAEMNFDTKVVLVAFKLNKLSPLALRQAVSKAGYDADEIKADPSAVMLLPRCCQPGGH
jgi:copper chaperone CopZ